MHDVFKPYTDPTGVYHRNGKDSYCAFAVKIYPTLTYDYLFMAKEGHYGKDAKREAKGKRQFGKVGVLGSIYRMGGGGWGHGKASYVDHVEGCEWIGKKRPRCHCPKVYDRIRTGLWGFAYGQGVDMEMKDAHMVTEVFRNSYPEICDPKTGIWVQLENAVMDVMEGINTKRYLGPNDCILIDKVPILGRNPMMRIHLPSGRRLHYMDASVQPTLMPWKSQDGADVYRPALHYRQETDTATWADVHTHGGKLFENIVQGFCRDILAIKMLEFEKRDLPVRGHVHDEGLSLTPKDPFAPGLAEKVDIMSAPISWAPGMLLGADGFEEEFWHK